MNAFERTTLFDEDERYDFAYKLYQRLGSPDDEVCKGDLRHTLEVLEEMGFTRDRTYKMVAWLNGLGWHCDCEVMMNVVLGDE